MTNLPVADGEETNASPSTISIGWASTDVTPEGPASIMGQFYARVSEGVRDPLTATALALRSGGDHAVFVSCDFTVISDDLYEAVRQRLQQQAECAGLDPRKVVLNATHTHTSVDIRKPSIFSSISGTGVELEMTDTEAYLDFAAERIAQAVAQAWNGMKEGGIAFGQSYTVIGRNRRWVDAEGHSTMYGLKPEVADRFRHVEGYEDHSVNVVATYDAEERLTGLIVNVACTAQEEESGYLLSADWWHETRLDLRRRFGESIFVLAQCSAAGELTSHLLYDQPAQQRMMRLKERDARHEIASRIGTALEDILPYIQKDIRKTVVLRHRVDTVPLPMNALTREMAEEAEREAAVWRQAYERERQKLEAQPESREQPRWYKNVTQAYRRMNWYGNVTQRYEMLQTRQTLDAELHVVRLGDIVFATFPHEYYLDYGIQIKVRSPAIQTFLVQLAGPGTYVPSPRSVAGGGYGSVPMSNILGPEAGQKMAEHAVQTIRNVMELS